MFKRSTAIVLALALSVSVVAQDSQVPDLSKFDEGQLRAIATQLYKRIAELEARVAELEGQLEEGKSGSSGTEWIVRVTGNEPLDVSAAQAQLEAERVKLAEIDESISKLNVELTKMRGMRLSRDRPRYSERDLEPMKAQIRNQEVQQRATRRKIGQLEREVQEAAATRILTGLTESNTPVRIIARGPYQVVASTMEAGKSYRVHGTGLDRGGDLQVLLRGAVEVTE